jgi:hypothetical protein
MTGRCAFQAARTPIAPTRPTVSWPGRYDRPVPDMPACRQRAPSVSQMLLPPLRLRSPFKSAPAYRVRAQSFHDSDAE